MSHKRPVSDAEILKSLADQAKAVRSQKIWDARKRLQRVARDYSLGFCSHRKSVREIVLIMVELKLEASGGILAVVEDSLRDLSKMESHGTGGAQP